jgi:hypothetical protein
VSTSSVEVKEILEEAPALASLPLAAVVVVVAVALVVAMAIVVAPRLGDTALTFDLAEEVVVVVVAGVHPALADEDLVELAAIEPDPAAFGAGVDQDVGALDLDEP